MSCVAACVPHSRYTGQSNDNPHDDAPFFRMAPLTVDAPLPGRLLPMAPKRTLDIITSTIAMCGLWPAATQDTPDFAKKPPLAAPLRLARNFTFLNDKPLFQVIITVSNTVAAVMT